MKKLGDLNIDFVGKKKMFFSISIGILLIGFIFNIIFSTQLDIKFKGGAILTYDYTGEISEDAVKGAVSEFIGNDMDVSWGGGDALTKTTHFSISISSEINVETQKKVTEALTNTFPGNNISHPNVDSVSPSVGKDSLIKGVLAILVASIFMVIYIGFRFKNIGGLSAGMMAVIALLHDCVVVYFAFVIFRIPINESFIAVVLTILGYSLNDTIVIYDRIRENKTLYENKLSFDQLVNKSMNQSLTRSVNTSVATFIAVATIVVVAAIAGLESIQSFAIPMMFGVISGCYSTVCIATQLWVVWKNFRSKRAAKVV